MKAKRAKESGAVLLEIKDKDEHLLTSATTETAFRIKEILVPIDFSDCSKKALRYAVALAKEHEASLTLLYVLFTPAPIGENSALDYLHASNETRCKAQRDLAALAAAEVHGQVIAKSFVRAGSPTSEILEAAESIPADMIVMSTHGRTGLKHALLGSVTEQVVRRAPCPVLIVRERQHECLANA
jgi:nucleotide-binding universal stress UspA family protein